MGEIGKIDVVFTIDMGYLQHFVVACTSLVENSSSCIGRIMLVHDIAPCADLMKGLAFFKETYGVEIEQYYIRNDTFEKLFVSNHLSNATYYRFLLAEILPQEIDKVLFLDSDIIVTDDLTSLLQLNFAFNQSHLMLYAADHEFDEQGLKDFNDRFHVKINNYFNAGVMLINLKAWREKYLSQILMENAVKHHDKLIFHDQDVLNITFREHWATLGPEFNDMRFSVSNRLQNFESIIIHYIGSSKPWHFLNQHPKKKLYWRYLKKTPFKNYKSPDMTLVNTIKRFIPFKNFISSILKKVLNVLYSSKG